ncbi:MAG: hypothetical protein GJ680_01305 [Alteromonadaceae bacterium]|nr:hypothetical protein [Alteromonadaceae bacterium]
MMSKKAIFLASMLAASISNQVGADDVFPKLQGDWFGQPIPGSTPKVFAPGLVSLEGRYEFGMSFSPDLDELYFTALKTGDEDNPEIYYSKIESGYWSKPKKANFSKNKLIYELLPHVSLIQDRLYFSGRTTPSKDSSGIWYVTRKQNGWSEASRLDVMPNKGRLSDYNQGKNGQIIFTNMPERKMYTANHVDGQITELRPLEIEFGLHGFISPTQDYLLVNARNNDDENRRDSDLYVYFKNQDGTWSKPINLGTQVNTTYSETVARVTPDGKFLFFGRYNEPGRVSNIYWVSTDVIYDLKKRFEEKS